LSRYGQEKDVKECLGDLEYEGFIEIEIVCHIAEEQR